MLKSAVTSPKLMSVATMASSWLWTTIYRSAFGSYRQEFTRYTRVFSSSMQMLKNQMLA
ncbi:MAG: hypothetical protein V7K62_06105 [Nostoc sp.]|uniref:hypothetical protein n=1 Tax=Nostoc sp. TaxID=1180 RepID=UPI002FFD4C63